MINFLNRFHIDDGIDIQFGHSSSDAESGNNSNGYYGVNKHTTDHSKRTLKYVLLNKN